MIQWHANMRKWIVHALHHCIVNWSTFRILCIRTKVRLLVLAGITLLLCYAYRIIYRYDVQLYNIPYVYSRVNLYYRPPLLTYTHLITHTPHAPHTPMQSPTHITHHPYTPHTTHAPTSHIIHSHRMHIPRGRYCTCTSSTPSTHAIHTRTRSFWWISRNIRESPIRYTVDS